MGALSRLPGERDYLHGRAQSNQNYLGGQLHKAIEPGEDRDLWREGYARGRKEGYHAGRNGFLAFFLGFVAGGFAGYLAVLNHVIR